MPNLKNSKITIAGAGLVGSLLAILWRQRGFQVEVFERRHDIRTYKKNAGRSINLVITSRGIHALKQAKLWERVSEICVPVYGRMIHDLAGQQSYQPYGIKGECNYSVSRGELNKLLIDEAEKAGAKFYFDHSIDRVDLDKKQIYFSDNQSHISYEKLFATDGAGSEIRKSMIEKNPAISEKIVPFPADYKELLMPADEKGNYKINSNALHIWPRGSEMLMALPNPQGSFTMTLYLPREKFESLTSPEKLATYFKAKFPDAVPLMPDYLDNFFDNPQGHLNTLFLSHWVFEDSICLMGDAAHAIVPFFGQGMNCGFEDVTVLFEEFDKSKSWQECFDNYFKERKPNADAIAEMAIENGREMSEKVGDQKFLLKKQIEHKIEEALPDIYRSRYALITYSLVPYSKAMQIGKIQESILANILEKVRTPEDLDIDLTKKIIHEKLTPVFSKLELGYL